MKKYADVKGEEREFTLGDCVYMKLQPYQQLSVALQRNTMLAPRFYGPFQVVERIGGMAYRLKLLEGLLIQPVFHFSQVKKQLSRDLDHFPQLPLVDALGLLKSKPEVCKRKVVYLPLVVFI